MSGAFQGHVLVVDDDPSICRMFQLLLHDAGYRVSIVGSGEDVLHFLKVLSPDVILLDISLPGINGVEVARIIKQDPARAFIPIILITALGDMKTKVSGLDAGADDFLVKPVEFAELLARVRAMMRLQNSRRGLQEAKQKIEGLLAFSQMLSTSIDVEMLSHRIVTQMRDAVGAIRGSIILINDQSLPIVVSTTQQEIDPPMITHIMRDGVAGWVVRAGKPLLLPDARLDQRWVRSQRILDVTSSVACVPIVHNQTVLGVITLVHNRVAFFSQDHLDLIQSMAAQSAVALQNARLFSLTHHQKHELEQRSQHLEEILNVGERLRLNLPLEATLSEIAEAIRRSLRFERVVIHLLASATGGLVVRGLAGGRPGAMLPELSDAALQRTLAAPVMKRLRVSRSFMLPALLDEQSTVAPAPGQPWQVGDQLMTPIGASGNWLGVISVDVPHDGLVPPLETIQSLEVFADQVASAVHNNQVFGREQERANQLQLLVDVSHSLTELMTPDQVGRLVTSLIQHTFGFFSVAILLREHDELVLRAAADAAGNQAPLGLRVPLAQEWAAHLLDHYRTGQSVLDHSLERLLSYSWMTTPIHSELAVPIITRNEVLGVLAVASDQSDAFDQTSETMLTALAAQLSVALENAQLFAREQAHVQQLNRVNTLSVKLTAELDVSEILDEVLAEIATIFDASRAALILFDEFDQASMLAASLPAGQVAEGLPPPADLTEAIPERQPLIIATLQTNNLPLAMLMRVLQMQVGVVAPLPMSDRFAGLLVLERDLQATSWRTSDRNLVQTIANLLAQSIENSQLYRRVADERRTLSAVLSSAADPLLVIGPQRELLLLNRAAEESLGLKRSAIGQPIDDPALLAMLEDDPKAGQEFRLADGRIVRPSIAPVEAREGGGVGQVIMLQDITALKLLEQQRLQRLRDDMLRYMSPPVVEQLMAEEGFGEATERDVVVVFADLRGFTALSEGLAPRIVVDQVLNRFFALMTEVLYDHEATIDKFMGDGIMAVFGSPRSRPDDVERAVSAAIAMQQVFPQLRAAWNLEFERDMGMGIGISYGRAVVGNLGSPQRLDYTLVGDVVNTASRLVDIALGSQIIVSDRIVEQLNNTAGYVFNKLPPVELKGKAERIEIYEVIYETEEEIGH